MQTIGLVTPVVAAYDKAIAFHVDRLGFVLVTDEQQGGGKRWVVVAPRSDHGPRWVLPRGTAPRAIRDRGGVRGPLRQGLGSDRAGSGAAGLAGLN